ncbi:MAG TPA: GtrA family protein [Burkholderiales bacterium]|nr:GtrA family protein [Burkholderiales bacterium]
MSRLRGIAHEGARYLGAGAFALAVDTGIYSGLIRLAGVHYLVAAPIGFGVGLAIVYALSVRWVFRHRRLKDDARAEFTLFALLGIAGLAINQGIIYAGVEWLALGYEPAKLLSAGVVFCFNFGSRKLLLFTRY